MMTAVLAMVLTIAAPPDAAPVGQASRLSVGQASRLPVGQASRLPVGQPSRLPVGQPSRLPVGQASGLPSAQTPSPVTVQAADPALALDDTRWTLSKGTLTVAAPAETSTVTLSFRNGSLSASSGCNRGTTGYQVRDGALVAGMFAITRMACADWLMKWESAFFKFLASKPTVSRQGEALVLKAANEELTFRRALR